MMARLYGRRPRGTRLVDCAPAGHCRTPTLMSAVRLEGVVAVEGAGCRLAYLPPYSPDFNPIENMWSKVKAPLSKAAARTLDAVAEAVKHALRSITAADCEGYFEHCGYGDLST